MSLPRSRLLAPLSLAILVVLGLVGAACSSSGTSSAAPTSTTAPPTASNPTAAPTTAPPTAAPTTAPPTAPTTAPTAAAAGSLTLQPYENAKFSLVVPTEWPKTTDTGDVVIWAKPSDGFTLAAASLASVAVNDEASHRAFYTGFLPTALGSLGATDVTIGQVQVKPNAPNVSVGQFRLNVAGTPAVGATALIQNSANNDVYILTVVVPDAKKDAYGPSVQQMLASWMAKF